MPIISNLATKVTCTWFGPKGRNAALMILLLSYFVPETIDEFMELDLTSIQLYVAIVSTIVLPMSLLLTYESPDYSPSMSEEERFIAGRIPFKRQLLMLAQNKNFLKVTAANSILLFSNHQIHRLLEILYYDIHEKMRDFLFTKELYLICTISGLLTFGMAFYSGLSFNFGYKLMWVQFVAVFVLQVLAMLIEGKVFMILIYVYDGVVKGGMMILLFELTAEQCFPVGESLSLGLLNALQFFGNFLFSFVEQLLVSPLLPHNEQHRLFESYLWFYIALSIVIILLVLLAFFLVYSSEIKMVRYQFDAVALPEEAGEHADEYETNEEEMPRFGAAQPEAEGTNQKRYY